MRRYVLYPLLACLSLLGCAVMQDHTHPPSQVDEFNKTTLSTEKGPVAEPTSSSDPKASSVPEPFVPDERNRQLLKETEELVRTETKLLAALDSLSTTSDVRLYRPFPDIGNLKGEALEAMTIKIDEYRFDARPVRLIGQDREELAMLLADRKKIAPIDRATWVANGPPDAALEWKVGQETYRGLFIVKQRQLWVVGPDIESFLEFRLAKGSRPLPSILKNVGR